MSNKACMLCQSSLETSPADLMQVVVTGYEVELDAEFSPGVIRSRSVFLPDKTQPLNPCLAELADGSLLSFKAPLQIHIDTG